MQFLFLSLEVEGGEKKASAASHCNTAAVGDCHDFLGCCSLTKCSTLEMKKEDILDYS